MPRVGRNDPCPCGSGRKYKQCCLPKVQASQVRSLSLRRDDELLTARLMAFGQRPAFSLDVQSAFSRFWNGDYDLSAIEVLGPEHVGAFLEWYLYDYRTTKDRQRIVDLFAAEEGPRLTEDLRALLAEREVAYLSLYGIEAVEPEGRLEVGDLLAGGFYTIEDAGLARLAMPGDLLLGRRLGNGSDGRMSHGTVLLPAHLTQLLVPATKRAYGLYRDEHYGATWPEFLREAGVVMFHILIGPEAAAYYALLSKREGYFDPQPVVQGMRAIMQRKAEELARQAAEEEEKRRQETAEAPEGPPVERTSGGILIPGQPKPPAGSEGGLILPGHLNK